MFGEGILVIFIHFFTIYNPVWKILQICELDSTERLMYVDGQMEVHPGSQAIVKLI